MFKLIIKQDDVEITSHEFSLPKAEPKKHRVSFELPESSRQALVDKYKMIKDDAIRQKAPELAIQPSPQPASSDRHKAADAIVNVSITNGEIIEPASQKFHCIRGSDILFINFEYKFKALVDGSCSSIWQLSDQLIASPFAHASDCFGTGIALDCDNLVHDKGYGILIGAVIGERHYQLTQNVKKDARYICNLQFTSKFV
jgi:hypothetical protein